MLRVLKKRKKRFTELNDALFLLQNFSFNCAGLIVSAFTLFLIAHRIDSVSESPMITPSIQYRWDPLLRTILLFCNSCEIKAIGCLEINCDAIFIHSIHVVKITGHPPRLQRLFFLLNDFFQYLFFKLPEIVFPFVLKIVLTSSLPFFQSTHQYQ